MNARNVAFWSEDITNTEGRALYSTMNQAGFTQLIHEPTRIVNSRRSCIDLIFSLNPNLIIDAGVRPKISDLCDHSPIYATLKYTTTRPKAYKRWVWDFKRGDYDSLRQCLLYAQWNCCYADRDVNTTVNNWMSLFLECIEAYVPHYETTIRPQDKDFMNSSLRHLMTKRNRLYKQYKQSGDENTGSAYKKLRNEVVREIRKAKKDQQDKLDAKIFNVNTTSKSWWKVCKESLGASSSDLKGPLLLGNKLISNDQEKASLLNAFFASQSTLATTPPDLPDFELDASQPNIDFLIIQPEEVYKILSNLDPNKSTGPDGIGNKILKEVALPLSKPLAELFNFCLCLGTFPDQWKIAQVIPIFKKGDPLQCTNYHPISLLPCISKVFEKLLFNHIFSFLKTHSLLNKHQSGFIPGDSTVNQLIAICDKLSGHLDKGEDVIGVFLDLTKAFDKVWHKGLLFKLNKIGIVGNIYQILSSYLNKRHQFVALHGCKSEPKCIEAGVPQGSVLGPLLFLIYINDITDGLTKESFLFADDTSLFCPVEGGNIVRAAQSANAELERIHQWAKRWLVTINPTKTVVMLFSKKRHPPKLPHLILNGNQLKVVTSHRHLGVILTPTLNWSEHINLIVSKCSRLLAILKQFKYRWSRMALETCYKSFIRPIIEYGNILYDSCTVKLSKQLESLQGEAARLVTGTKKGTSVSGLIRELGWKSLEARRSDAKLVKIYEITHNKAPEYLTVILSRFQCIRSGSHFTRSQAQGILTIPRCKSTLYQKSFFVSGISSWNRLSDTVKSSTSRLSFKRKLCANATIAMPFPHKVPRHSQVVFAQLRSGFSDLKGHLYLKGCISTNYCTCGLAVEDTKHYLLECVQYSTARAELIRRLLLIKHDITPTAPLLLFGSDDISHEDNMHIFLIVCDFIKHSGRFKFK